MALIKKTRTIAMHKRDSFWKIKFRDPKLSFKPQIFKGKNSYLMKEKQLGFFTRYQKYAIKYKITHNCHLRAS